MFRFSLQGSAFFVNENDGTATLQSWESFCNSALYFMVDFVVQYSTLVCRAIA